MNYELALELKDAGYPQRVLKGTPMRRSSRSEWAYAPTLLELIDECGDDFHSLRRMINGFIADNCGVESPMDDDGKRIKVYAGFADETVARLYLLVNKK